MKAIILAAGFAKRMLPLAENIPKNLLELEEGLTILDLQLRNLEKASIKDVVIVTGYKGELIEKKVKEYNHLNIRVIHNPFYDVSNNLVSLWFAKEEMNEDFIFLNSDNVFHPDVIRDLINNSHDGVKLSVGRKEWCDEDDVKVLIRGNKVLDLSKAIDPSETKFESIGIVKFQGMGVRKAKESIERLVKDQNNRDGYWLELIKELIKDELVDIHEIDPNKWAELDFPEDLEEAKKNLKNYK